MYEPVRTLSATVWRKTSTPRTSAMLGEERYVSFGRKKSEEESLGWNGMMRGFRGAVNAGLLLTSPRFHAPDRGARLQRDRYSR